MPRERRSLNQNLIIAPSRDGGKWTVKNWQDIAFASQEDWDKAVSIFEDRINFRYMNVIREIDSNGKFSGFSVMALSCMLIETLAQFYDGLENSNDAKFPCGHAMNNTDFYSQFLTSKSFVLSQYFNDQQARIFYQDIRCGLLHACETGGNSKIKLRDGENLFRQTGGALTVYRKQFAKVIADEFNAYCSHLRANDNREELRPNYRNKMNYICGLPEFEL